MSVWFGIIVSNCFIERINFWDSVNYMFVEDFWIQTQKRGYKLFLRNQSS